MGFCKKKKIDSGQENEALGKKWIWTALDTPTRLIVSFLIGNRTLEDAHCFLKDLTLRIDGNPLFTSDELPHYADGLKKLFHKLIYHTPTGHRGRPRNPEMKVNEDLDYATVHKTRVSGRIVKVETKVVFGSNDRINKRMEELPGNKINTSYVERSNLNWRMWDSHLSRKSLMYAKSFRWLKAKFSICVAFYNFIRPHETLSRLDDRSFEPKTPAMAAGITDHQWSIQELLVCKL